MACKSATVTQNSNLILVKWALRTSEKTYKAMQQVIQLNAQDSTGSEAAQDSTRHRQRGSTGHKTATLRFSPPCFSPLRFNSLRFSLSC